MNSDDKSSSSTKVAHHPLLLQVPLIPLLLFWGLSPSLYENLFGNCNTWLEIISSSYLCTHQILSEEIGCQSDEIIGMELNVCDTQPSCLGGGYNEFIYSGRLDNLASCYCALRSLMDSSKAAEQLSNEKAIRMVAMFDNEEVRYMHKKCCPAWDVSQYILLYWWRIYLCISRFLFLIRILFKMAICLRWP